MGVDPGSNGSILLDNGANWNQTGGRVFIGEKSPGSLTITNNSHFIHTNSNDIFKVGGGNGGNEVGQGTLSIDSTSSLATSRGLNIGDGRNAGISSTGVVNVTGGTINALTGGTDEHFKIGTRGGIGTLNVTSGGAVTTNNGWFSLGQDNDAVGTATFSGAGTTLTSRGIIVGWSGTGMGTLNILNGAVVNNSTRELSVGRDQSTATGVINITNAVLNAGRDFRIGGQGSGTVNINGGTFNSAGGWGIIGDGGAAVGIVNMTNGSFTHADTLLLSNNPGAQGTFTQNGASTTVLTGELIVGRNGGTGLLNLNGGTFTVGAATQVGRDSATAVGTINIASGAILNSGRDLRVGQQGLGTVNINGGTLNSSGGWAIVGDGGASVGLVTVTNGFFNHLNDSLLLGNNPGAQGTFTQIGSSSVTRIGNELIVGRNGGTGTLNVTGGAFNAGSQADVGREGPGTGTINVNGTGKLTLGGGVNIGRSGNGTGFLTIGGGGALTSGGEVNFGYDGGTNGTGTVTGGRMTNTSYFIVGRAGTGTFTQSGGSVNNTSEQLRVGNDGSGVGTFNMSGGIYTSFSHGMIGESGNGTLNLSGGVMNIGCGNGGNLYIAHNNGSSGVVNMSGGLLKTDGGFVEFNSQGGAALSTLNLNGGVLVTNYLNNQSGNALATISINGGTLRALSDEGNFIRGFTTAQVQLTGSGLTVDTDSRTVSINMALGGAGGITKTGLGQLNLTTTQANAGATRVNAGVLNLDFANVANTNDLVANAGLTLAGGTLRMNGSNGGVESQTFSGTNLLSGASAVVAVENGGGTSTMNLAAITRNAGGTVDFTLPALGAITTSNSNDAGGLLSGGATVGDIWASVSGGNIAAYSGGFSATFGAGLNFDTAGSATDGGTVHSIRFSGGPATVTLNANSTVVSGGILVSSAVGANNVEITGQTLTSGAADLIVIQNNAAGDLIIGSQIDGAIALTKSGVGELVLTNAGNSYAGGTFINAGTVTIGADGALGGAAGGLTFAASSLASGGILHTTADMVLGAGRSVTLNSGGGGFDVDTATTLTIGQGITGSGGLGKLGAGILSLTGANTYTGATAVYAGELQVTGSLTGSSGLIVNGLLSVGTGGSIASTGEIHVAQGSGNPDGTLTISGVGASVTGTDVIIGENGTGTGIANIINGGTLTAECRLYVGRFGGSNGILNVLGGSVVNANEYAVIGDQGGSTGTVNLSGDATLNVSAQLRVAENGTGSLTLNGTSVVNLLTRTNHYLGVGNGTGTLTVNGGKVNFATGSTIEAGWGGSATGNLVQAGGEITGAPLIVIGRDGTGTANISGGTTTYRGFEIGNNGGSGNGTVSLSGTANVIGAASVYVGRNSGNATLNLNGGMLTTNSIVHEGNGTSQVNFNGTTIKPNADNANFINNFSAATTDVQAGGAIFDTNGKTIKVATELDGVGSLTKNGAGTLTLSGNSSYAGGVNLNTGTISVRHNSALGTGTLIGNGGRLSFDNSGGAGLIEGRITYGSNADDETSPIPGDAVTLGTPRAHSTDAAAFGDNSTWGYRGKLVVPAGPGVTWSFAEQFDDNVLLKIDGTTLINDGNWNNPIQTTLFLAAGEHDIEIRFGQGGGGVGPNNGWNIGFGVDFTGAGTTNPGNYVALADPGDGSLLRYNDEGGIDYTVANAAVLNAMTEVFVKQFGANLTGDISGAGGLNKTGAGRLTLTGANSYAGGTTINDGTLSINANAALGALASGVTINNNAVLQAAGTVTTDRTVTLGTGGGQIDANGNTVTLDTLSTLTGTALTTDDTAGGGVVNIKGAQTYNALTTEGLGVTNLYTALGTGTSTITANATLNIYVSQTLASLDIGAGTEVTFGDGLPFTSLPPAKFGPGAVGVVPEPGSLGLLVVGALGFISRRRRSC